MPFPELEAQAAQALLVAAVAAGDLPGMGPGAKPSVMAPKGHALLGLLLETVTGFMVCLNIGQVLVTTFRELLIQQLCHRVNLILKVK